MYQYWFTGFLGGSVVKDLPANVGEAKDVGWIPESGRSLWTGNSNPLRYSCLENSMDRGASWAIVHGVRKSQTRLSTHTFCFTSCDKCIILYKIWTKKIGCRANKSDLYRIFTTFTNLKWYQRFFKTCHDHERQGKFEDGSRLKENKE